MGIKANYKIKTPNRVGFLNRIGVSKDDFVKKETKGKGAMEIVYRFGVDLQKDLAERLNELRSVDTGDLITSMTFQMKRFGTVLRFSFLLNDYYKFLDKGVKPGGKFPWDSSKGIQPDGQGNVIYQWLKRNNIVMYNRGTVSSIKTKRLKVKGGKKSNQLTLAYLIGRKIQKKGRKGNKFFTTTVKDGRIQKLQEDLSEALKTDIIIDIKDFVNEIKK